jgi:hypothetical protein
MDWSWTNFDPSAPNAISGSSVDTALVWYAALNRLPLVTPETEFKANGAPKKRIIYKASPEREQKNPKGHRAAEQITRQVLMHSLLGVSRFGQLPD